MVRKFKHHEQKLLKKVDFLQYKDDPIRENSVLRRYHCSKVEYQKYNILCGMVRKLTHKLSLLDPKDEFRTTKTNHLIDKLYRMGILTAKKSLAECEKITVSAICRRRLAVIVMKLKMAETLKAAVTFIEQGHIRVGPNTVDDPAFLVTRF